MKILFLLALLMLANTTDPHLSNHYASCDIDGIDAQFCESLQRNGACAPGQCNCVELWSSYLSCMMEKISDIRTGKIRLGRDPADPNHPDRPPSDE